MLTEFSHSNHSLKLSVFIQCIFNEKCLVEPLTDASLCLSRFHYPSFLSLFFRIVENILQKVIYVTLFCSFPSISLSAENILLILEDDFSSIFFIMDLKQLILKLTHEVGKIFIGKQFATSIVWMEIFFFCQCLTLLDDYLRFIH